MKKVLYMALAAALLCSCGKNSDPEKPIEKPDPSVVPAPPEEIISNNTFVVDYFTDMKDSESYFSKRDVNVAKEYILGDAGKNSVMYFFDRMDFTVGKTTPAVKMCTNKKIYPFFAQQEASGSGVIKGCGIITKTSISDFDGLYDASVFMSGANIHIQCGIPGRTTFYTSRIDKIAQLTEIFSKKAQKLSADAVIIGRVKNGLEKELEQVVAGQCCRAFIVTGTAGWSLYVICPPEYVCRSAESKSLVNLDYYKITIEKIKL